MNRATFWPTLEPGEIWRPKLWRRVLLGERSRIVLPFWHPCLTSGFMAFWSGGDAKRTIMTQLQFRDWIVKTGATQP